MSKNFCLKTMELTRKCVSLELTGIKRDYNGGCFENAMSKCDSIVREVKRLKKCLAIDRRERNRKGRRVKVKLSTTITGNICVLVPEGVDAAKYVEGFLRRKDIRVAKSGTYSNETAELQDGEETKTIYLLRS